ncbi:MAG TPA: vWA domain-containing protein [Kofleriaceae bacterium]|nr:vWA domain-containing protein [Kofleriaceae bacterium]
MAPLRLASTLLLAALGTACDGSVDGGGGGGGGGGGADGGPVPGVDAPGCDQVESVQAEPGDPADLLLVVDKSGSMDDRLDTGQDKWQVMRGALTTVVNQYESGIRFGLMTYPADNECAPGSVRAEVAAQNADAIVDILQDTSPNGGTPTHTSIDAARAYYQGVSSDGARYVLLATDGEPNCGDPNDSQEPTVDESIAAIAALLGDGIQTFVLGFGGTINNYPEILDAMAEAGGTGDYFAANSPEELATALDAIAGEVGLPSCSFRLDEVPPDPDSISAFQDSDQVPRDPSHQNGWDYDETNNTVTFYGPACDAIRGGEVALVSFDWGGCGGPVVD